MKQLVEWSPAAIKAAAEALEGYMAEHLVLCDMAAEAALKAALEAEHRHSAGDQGPSKITEQIGALIGELESQGARVTRLPTPVDDEPGLTVAELIAQLQALPQTWKVKVQVGATEDLGDGVGLEEWRGVEGWEAGSGEVLLHAVEDQE